MDRLQAAQDCFRSQVSGCTVKQSLAWQPARLSVCVRPDKHSSKGRNHEMLVHEPRKQDPAHPALCGLNPYCRQYGKKSML